MRGRNFKGWDVETFAEDEDAATQVYFDPPEPETDQLPQLTTDPGEPASPVRSFEVDGTWRVPSLSPTSVGAPEPLARVPASTNPPPLFTTKGAPQMFPTKATPTGSYSRKPAPQPMATSAAWAIPSPASLPHFEPSILAMARPRPSHRASRRFQRPALGVFVAAACVLVGIGVGGFLAATGHSHAAVEAAPAHVVMSPTVTMTAPAPAPAAPIVEPIVEPAPAPAPAAVTAPAPAPVAAPAPAPEPAKILPPPQPTFAAAPKKHHTVVTAPAVEAGTGKLAISSKPPCSIVIDGKDTGLVAPQRAIELAAGKHEVTLINVDEGIHLTTEVAITADRSTQLIRDFTN